MIAEWVDDVTSLLLDEPEWEGWEFKTGSYDLRSSLNLNDVESLIKSRPGPCVLVKSYQEKVRQELTDRLRTRSIVFPCEVRESEDLIDALCTARDLHLDGKPLYQRKIVASIQLISKLEALNLWGGNNTKGFMWSDDLSNGRGYSPEFANDLPAILSDLLSAGLLISKRSKGCKKYALNPQERGAVHEILKTFRFPGDLHRILSRDTRMVSARDLDDVVARRQQSGSGG